MNEHDYFPIAAAINELAEATDEHDGERMIRAADYLDAAPTILLRGMAFLSNCLEDHKDAPPLQVHLARSAIQEVTALVAVLMEVKCMAEFHRLCQKQKEGKA